MSQNQKISESPEFKTTKSIKKKKTDAKAILKHLLLTEDKLTDNGLYWNFPTCPDSKCLGVLTNYIGTQKKLLCLKCGNVYEMTFLSKEA